MNRVPCLWPVTLVLVASVSLMSGIVSAASLESLFAPKAELWSRWSPHQPIGCPNLQKRAFTADNAEPLLNKAARDYVNHPRGVDVSGNQLTASKICKWFAADFVIDSGVIPHLERFAAAELAAKLKRTQGPDDYDYDWRLNNAP